MNRLNPFAKQQAVLVAKQAADRHAKRAATIKAKRSKAGRADKHKRTATQKALHEGLQAAYKSAEDLIAEDEKAGNYAPGETDDENDE